MVVVLCHLGDSPMHAEICNTMNPAITLTPCRICPLQVDTMVEKKTEEFIQQFVGLDSKYKHVSHVFYLQRIGSDSCFLNLNLSECFAQA